MEEKIAVGKQILKTLHKNGFEAFFVGGFVRDYLLKIPVTDIDITTDATTEEVSELFDKVILTGERYGTVTVLIDRLPFEVTTYRVDSTYSDFRHPDQVAFTRNLSEDLARRDFTINQLIMDSDGTIHDHHRGLNDLEKRIIKTINDPTERFKEDALRMLRAFRFAAKLGFDIEAKTLEAIGDMKLLIQNIAMERVQEELTRIFNATHTKHALTLMIQSRFHEALFGLKEGFEKLASIDKDYDDFLALTVLYIEGGDLVNIFKLAKKKLKEIEEVALLHSNTKGASFTKKMLFDHGLKTCLLANRINSLYGFTDRTRLLEKMYEALPIKAMIELKYRGEQIISDLDIKHKKHIGQLLDYLIFQVIENNLENKKTLLKKAAKDYLIILESELER